MKVEKGLTEKEINVLRKSGYNIQKYWSVTNKETGIPYALLPTSGLAQEFYYKHIPKVEQPFFEIEEYDLQVR